MVPESAYSLVSDVCAGTVRRFLEKHQDKITAVVFCIASATDTDIYKRSADSHRSWKVVLSNCVAQVLERTPV
jgi:hypothetical protein